MKDNLAALGKAALVGGLFGVVGAALAIAFAFTPIYAQGGSVVFVLAAMGLIGVVLFLTGIQPKLEAWAGMGAMLNFGALAAIIAQMTYVTGKTKKSAIKGVVTPLKEIYLKVILIALAVGMAIGALAHFTELFYTGHLAPYNPGGVLVDKLGPPNGPLLPPEGGSPQGTPIGINYLVFLWSFVVTALISAAAQLVVMLSGVRMPTFFLWSIILGAALTPFGIMKALVQIAGGGFQILIFDAGEAMVGTFYNILFRGDPLPFVMVMVTLIFLGLIGMIGGWIKLSMDKGKDKE
ncbi:MAG: hypothetical protein FWF91_03115 [Coriobacteriia bacterium]|nr:hypothetical protein [Coriobacteriia bacterium]